MKISALLSLVAIGVSVSGCATIVDGTTESISVASTPVEGASCRLTNTEGTWYVTTPGNAVVHKTKNDLHVHCTEPGYGPGNLVAVSKFGGATFGNIVAGGIIGAGIDAASGANYYYSTPITVPLGPPTAKAAATAKRTAPTTPSS